MNYQIGDQSQKFYILHWDAKNMKSLRHCDDGIERIAIVMTGKDAIMKENFAIKTKFLKVER